MHIVPKGDLARSAFNHVGAAKTDLEIQLFHLPRCPMTDSFPKVMLPFKDDPTHKKTEVVWSAVELLEEAIRDFFGGQSWAKAEYNGLTTVSPTACLQLREGVRLLETVLEQAELRTKTENENELPQYVSLDQIALICGYKGKRTPERWIESGEMPAPAIEGGGGKAAFWIWSEIRIWLAEKTARILPERFPSLFEDKC